MTRLLAALGVVVLALVGGLWFMLHDGAPATDTDTDTPTAGRAAAHTDQGSGHAGPRTTTGPSARSRVSIPRVQAPHTPSAPSAPSIGGAPAAPEPEPATPTDQQLFRRSLVEQVGLSEPQITECVEKAMKSGATVDGTTAVSFTIAKGPNGKLGIETTGVEYSSIPDQATTSCIRDVGKSLTFDALPEGADRVIAYRKVVVKDGKVTENWLTEFANNPGQPPEPQ